MRVATIRETNKGKLYFCQFFSQIIVYARINFETIPIFRERANGVLEAEPWRARIL